MLKDRLVLGRQQIVGPGDRIPHGLQPGGHIARAAGQQLQPIRKTGKQRLGRKNLGAGRGKLDSERQPVETAADLGHRIRILRRELERVPHSAGAVDKKRDRGVLQERFR